MHLRVTNCIPVAQARNARDTRPFNFFEKGRLRQTTAKVCVYVYVRVCVSIPEAINN